MTIFFLNSTFQQVLRKSLRFFLFHFEGYVCSVANGDKFIKTSRVYSRNLCIKYRAALKRFNLLTSFDEKMKETNWDTLTFLLQKTNWNTSWWYPQWLSGVSSSFSVSPSVVQNCCRKCLLKWYILHLLTFGREWEPIVGNVGRDEG